MQGERRRRIVVGEIEPRSVPQRAAQLVEVLLVAERRVLVEPLRRQQFGRLTDRARAVHIDLGADEDLRRLGEDVAAEAERNAKPDVPLEEAEFADAQARGHRAAARRPAM